MSLEARGYASPRVAGFLMRCLFTMFAEDVELLPRQGFTRLLERLREQPEHFVAAVTTLWRNMNEGGYDAGLMARLKRFNGGLFRDIDPIPLTAAQIQGLIRRGPPGLAVRGAGHFRRPAGTRPGPPRTA